MSIDDRAVTPRTPARDPIGEATKYHARLRRNAVVGLVVAAGLLMGAHAYVYTHKQYTTHHYQK